MRGTALFREILRNLVSGTSRLGTYAAIALIGLSLLLLSDILTIAGTVRQAEEYRGSGAAVVTLSAPGRVDGVSCESLVEVADVIAAGAMRQVDPVVLTTLPAAPVEHYVTTPTFPSVLGATGDGGGTYASADLVQNLADGSASIDGRRVEVVGSYSYPPDGRRSGFGWALLSPTYSNDGAFDECWALAWPQKPDIRQLLLTTVTPPTDLSSSEQPQISQLNPQLGSRFTGTDSYAERPSQYAPFVAFVAAGVLAGVFVRIRRIEAASNLHAGSSRGVLTLQFVLESAAWAFPASALAWAVGVGFAALGAPSELAALASRSAQISFLFFAGSICGTVIAVSTVREQRLWRYVKSR